MDGAIYYSRVGVYLMHRLFREWSYLQALNNAFRVVPPLLYIILGIYSLHLTCIGRINTASTSNILQEVRIKVKVVQPFHSATYREWTSHAIARQLLTAIHSTPLFIHGLSPTKNILIVERPCMPSWFCLRPSPFLRVPNHHQNNASPFPIKYIPNHHQSDPSWHPVDRIQKQADAAAHTRFTRAASPTWRIMRQSRSLRDTSAREENQACRF